MESSRTPRKKFSEPPIIIHNVSPAALASGHSQIITLQDEQQKHLKTNPEDRQLITFKSNAAATTITKDQTIASKVQKTPKTTAPTTATTKQTISTPSRKPNSLESLASISSSRITNDDSTEVTHNAVADKWHSSCNETRKDSTDKRAAQLAGIIGETRRPPSTSITTAIIETRYVSPPELPPLDNESRRQRWRRSSGEKLQEVLRGSGGGAGVTSCEQSDQVMYIVDLNTGVSHQNVSTGEARRSDTSSSDRAFPEKFRDSSIATSAGGGGGSHKSRPTTIAIRGANSPSGGLQPPPATGPAGKPKPPFMFAGIVASIACSVLFSFSILCIKLLPDTESLQETTMAVAFRGLVFMVLCGVTIIIQGSSVRVKRDEIWVNVLRSIFGYLGVLGSYLALAYISMGDSIALVFSSPVWTSILSHFILDEPLQWIQLIALPASIFGIVLIAHPGLIVPSDLLPAMHEMSLPVDGDSITMSSPHPLEVFQNSSSLAASHQQSSDFEHRWPGVAIALLSSLLVSSVYIVLKFRKSTPIQTTTFWLGFTTFTASICIMSFIGFGHLPGSLYEASLVLGNGFFSWLGQSCLQWAFYYEDASVLSVVRTLDVAMCFLLSSIFLEDDIYWTSIVGSIIISLVVVSIMLNNWIQQVSRRPSRPVVASQTESGNTRKTIGDKLLEQDQQQLVSMKCHQHPTKESTNQVRA